MYPLELSFVVVFSPLVLSLFVYLSHCCTGHTFMYLSVTSMIWPRAEMVGSVWWGDAIHECVPVVLQSHGVQISLSFVTGSEASTNRATRTKSPWMVLGIHRYSWTYIAPWIIHGTCMDIQGSSMDIQRSSMWIHGSSMCVHGLQNNPWTMHGRYMPDQWDSVFSTMVHVGEKGIMLQACLTSFWLFSFWKKNDWPHKKIEPNLCFSTLVHVGKIGSGSKSWSGD